MISKRTKWVFWLSSIAALLLIGCGLWWLHSRSGSALLEQAELSIRAAKYDKALDQAKQYTEKHPNDWKGYYYQGRALMGSGQGEQARVVLDKAAGIEPGESPIWLLYSLTYSSEAAKLASARDSKQIQSAVDLYKSANDLFEKAKPTTDLNRLSLQEGHGLILIQWARAYQTLSARLVDDAMAAEAKRDTKTSEALKADSKAAADQVEPKLREATAMLLAVVQKDPSRAESSTALVQLCLERDDKATLAKASEAIKGTENPAPLAAMMLVMNDLKSSYTESGSGPVNRQKITAACQILDDILKKNPKDAKVKLARAELALRLDDLSTAQRLCEEAVKDGGRNAQAELLLGEVLSQRGDLAEAEKKLRQLKTDYPQFPDAQFAYARAALAAGKTDAATESLAALGKLDARQTRVQIMRCELALALNDLTTAQQACADILAAEPNNASARLIQLTVLARSGDIKTALAQLKAMRTELPKWPQLLLTYAHVADQAGQVSEALDAARQALAVDPENSLARRFVVDLQLRSGKNDDAFAQAEAFQRANPSDAGALVQYVQAAEQTGKADAARTVLSKAVVDNASKPEFLMSAVEAYGILHDTAAAKDLAQKVTVLQATGPADRMAIARALVLLDRTPEAEKVLSDELKKTPNDARLHFQMGQLCAGASRSLAAIDQFRAAAELDKNNPTYKVALARMLMDSGDVAESAKIVSEVDSSNAAANLLRLQIKVIQGEAVDAQHLQQATGGEKAGLALAYLSSGQLPKCVEICKAELQKTPDNADLRLMLARAYVAMGQHDEGIKQWEQVLKAGPGRLSNYLELAVLLGQGKGPDQVTQQMVNMPGAQEDMVHLAIGQILVKAGINDKAIAVLQQLAQRPSASDYLRGRACILLAQSLAASNKIEQATAECDKLSAIADWRKPALLAKAQILAQDKQKPQAQSVLASLSTLAEAQRDTAVLRAVAEVYMQLKEPAAALAVCDQIDKIQANDGRTWSLRARIYAADEKPSESVQAYRKAIELTPSDFTLYLSLVQALDAQGKPAEALAALKQLEDAGPGASALAQYQRGRLFAGWGLNDQAIECFTKLASMGQAASPQISLALADAYARLGQSDAAISAIKAIPAYASEYVQAQLLMAQIQPTIDARLAVIANLHRTAPGQPSVLVREMNTYLQANRPADAVAAFNSFKQALKGKAMPAEPSYMAVVTLVELGRQGEACQLASQVAADTPSRQWMLLASLLHSKAEAAQGLKLLPSPANASLYEAVCGYYHSRQLADDTKRQAWSKAIEKALTPPGKQAPVASRYLLLMYLADGNLPQAQALQAEMIKGAGIEGIAVQELMEAAQAQPAIADEAAVLLRATLASDAGLTGLARSLSMDVLKKRPTSQWAAAIALRAHPDLKTQAAILSLLKPADSPMALLAQAAKARSEGRFADAADATAKVAGKFPIPDLLMMQGLDLERAAKLPEAYALYRQVWDMTKSPASGNSLAYLTSQLYPKDSAKLSEAKAMMEAILPKQSRDPASLDTLGWLEYLLGDRQKACLDLRAAVRGLPGLAPVHYHLGMAESACGNNDLARWHFQSAINAADRAAANGGQPPVEIAQSAKLARAALGVLGPAK